MEDFGAQSLHLRCGSMTPASRATQPVTQLSVGLSVGLVASLYPNRTCTYKNSYVLLGTRIRFLLDEFIPYSIPFPPPRIVNGSSSAIQTLDLSPLTFFRESASHKSTEVAPCASCLTPYNKSLSPKSEDYCPLSESQSTVLLHGLLAILWGATFSLTYSTTRSRSAELTAEAPLQGGVKSHGSE